MASVTLQCDDSHDNIKTMVQKKVATRLSLALWPRQIEECDVGEILDSLEDDFVAVWGDVEIANVEVWREVGQLALGARVEVNEPEILVLNFTAQENERAATGQEGYVSRAASERQRRQNVRCSIGCDGLYRKCGADVGSRVDNELPVGRPGGID